MAALNQTQGKVNTVLADDTASQASAKAITKAKQTALKTSENPRQPATHTPPVMPVALTVSGQSDGTNTLAWKKMGNKPGTTYLVEYQNNANGGWTLLDTTTRSKYAATGFVPGQRTSYRVRAKRNEQNSAYSNEAVIYGNL